MYLTHYLRCKYSGIQVGTLSFQTTAGAIPYLLKWSELVPLHPVFSMEFGKLLEFTRTEWKRLASQADAEEISNSESETLRVAYLAVLHKLDCVRQDDEALPSLATVQSTIGKLLALAYWKFHLESKRFRFPTLHICRMNDNTNLKDIGYYLDECFEVKSDYESKVSEIAERAKIAAAQAAIDKLKNEWINPVSKKVLWTWVRVHLPEKYQPDAIGWLGTLFLGSAATVAEFDEEELDLMDEIIQASCPLGDGIMFAVRQRLKAIRDAWEQANKAFEIQLDMLDARNTVLVNGQRQEITDPGQAPKQSEFPTKGKWLIAYSKWEIAVAAYKKRQQEKEAGES